MARRYSGNLIITITWDEVRKKYIGEINVAGPKQILPVRIQATPPDKWQAIDTPEVVDALAHDALAFAADQNWPVDDYAEFDPAFNGEGSEYIIRRKPWIRQIK